ncbi:acid phosphatase/ protein serine/threonine phosphatase [Ectocarpus siliculosus]|uniref:Purple acid phosphatase n=1 Tax=Ectocarpus siliculosus TaxID=2880 RepID=D7FWJ2_ECTSI|nr:acid phosphatase/ protein serine/threonine phosphatase [Ectocarpus siliculosus]|eukprot:CBJ32080.1 acid phosphatase/ protein serine/threonine phosphatase [Ectocarpus siliculosus]
MLRFSDALRLRHIILRWTLLASALLRPTSSDLLKNKHEAVDRQPQQRFRGTPADAGDDPGQPEQIHLALAGGDRDMYAMSVSWLTWEETKSQVFWSRDMDMDVHAVGEVVVGNATRYSTHHTNLDLEEYTSGWLHSAVIQGLEPSTTIFYCVGDEDLALSTVRDFTTPGVFAPEQPLVLGILGDLGQTNDSRNTLDALGRHQPAIDVVLHAGDLAYAECIQERWDSFMRMLDPVASHVPWMVAAGNHEIEAGSTSSGPFAAFQHRFRMPSEAPAVRGFECGVAGGLDGNRTACGPGLNDLSTKGASAKESEAAEFGGEWMTQAVLGAREAVAPFERPVSSTGWPESEGGGGEEDEGEVEGLVPKCSPSEWSGTYDFGNSFYSFDVASVHVVVLNPYTATGEGSVQHSWLVEDLDGCDRSRTPWLVAMFHCPWHNSNLAHPGERMAATAMHAMEPVLFQHKASLAIAGHVHAYERSLPVLSGQLNDAGLVNLVVGGSGNNEGRDPDYYRLPDWSAFRNGSAFGFGTLSVMNSTMALWEWKSNEDDPMVHDAAWISNKCTDPFE